MTQNNNEALNQIIWKRCPKDTFVSRSTLQLGVCSAIIHFNYGYAGLLPIFNFWGMEIGTHLKYFCKRRDTERINISLRKSNDFTKKIRKFLNSKKKGYIDKQTEGVVYEAGGF